MHTTKSKPTLYHPSRIHLLLHVEMDVFEKEVVLEKKLDVEMDVFVLEKKL